MPAIITLPTSLWLANALRFFPRPRNVAAAGLLDGQRSVYGPVSRVWVVEWTSVPLAEADWAALEAVFLRLGGQAGAIRLGNPARRQPRLNRTSAVTTTYFSDATTFSDGTGFVSQALPAYCRIGEAASAEADSVLLSGLPVSTSPALYPGDLFEVRPGGVAATHGHLYQVVQQAATDASGETRVSIVPGLRAAVAVGDQVGLSDPTSVFRAVDDEQGIIEYMLAGHGRTGFSLVEVLP